MEDDPVLPFSRALVLTPRGEGISALTRFGLPELFEPFALPAALPPTASETPGARNG